MVFMNKLKDLLFGSGISVKWGRNTFIKLECMMMTNQFIRRQIIHK